MDISEFLRESIVEITDGLLKAQRQVGPYGVDIRTGEKGGAYSAIDFDIAVTTKEGSDTGGEAKLSVLGLDLKLGGNKDKDDTIASRIKFSVNFSIPEKELAAAAQQGKDNKA